MRNLLVTLSYRGTAYHGFQVQRNHSTIAQVFQDALQGVLGHRPDIKGCSRTDAGVHANMFCISFFTDRAIPCQALVKALNCRLPGDVAVMDCREVDQNFHARYSCTGKRYLYKVCNSQVKDPFLEDLALLYRRPLDEALLDRAAKGFLGTHDFIGFRSTGSSVEDTVRTLYDFNVTRQGKLVLFSVTGDGFLYNMVRILVGTLLDVAAGKLAPQEIPALVESRDRSRAGVTAPPHGLYLDHVYYQPMELL